MVVEADDNQPEPTQLTGGYCNYPYQVSSCDLIYIPVNFHFFVDDACDGTTAAIKSIDQFDQDEAFSVPERVVKRANQYFESIGNNNQWNQAYWNALITPPQWGVAFI